MKRAAAVIITNDKDEVLLVKRGGNNRGETKVWENPGGQIDGNESVEYAAKKRGFGGNRL